MKGKKRLTRLKRLELNDTSDPGLDPGPVKDVLVTSGDNSIVCGFYG